MDSCSIKLHRDLVVEFDYPPKFHLPRYIKMHGLMNYEPLSQALFLASVERSEGAVFDIGANIGVYAMGIATALRRSVYAFEPFTEAADVLRHVARTYNLPIHVSEVAVSDSLEDQQFYLSLKSDMSNSLNPDFREHRAIRTVKSVTIDSAAARVRPSAIKIDTETTEMDVLNGGHETFARDRPVVLIEVLTNDLATAVRGVFTGHDYTILEIGKPQVQQHLGDISDLMIDGDKRNWLAVPSEIPVSGAFYGRARYWLDALRGLNMA